MALRRYTHSATLITIFFVGLVSFVGIVYAMAWTLSSSTSETKDTMMAILGDFDGDGDLDYVDTNMELVTDVNKNDVYKNNGTGTFTLDSIFGHSQGNESFIGAADLDGDGDLDVVRAKADNSLIYTYTNNGAGVMTEHDSLSYPNTLSDMKLGDIDMDGDIDIVNSYSAGSLEIISYLNDGKGNFSPAHISSASNANSLALADMDSDGDLDVILLTTDYYFKVYANNGNGSFSLLSSTAVAPGMSGALAVGDLDGDGDIDIIGLYSGFTTYLNNGAGTVTAGASYASGSEAGGAVGLGDLDNDGDLDVEMPVTDSFGVSAGNQTWLNNGSAVFTQTGTPTENADCTKGVAIGDIDADGDLDYVAANNSCPSGSGRANRHYKSDQAATSANTAPTAATSLTASLTTSGHGSGVVLLSWGSGSDTQTSTRLLQYQVRLGTGTGLHQIASGITASPLWVSQEMPNGQARRRTIKNIPCNSSNTYYWAAATVDTGFKSTASCEGTFTLNSSCTLVDNGCNGAGSSGGTSGGGANWGWNVIRQGQGGGVQSLKSKISVSVFRDLDQDGKWSSYEDFFAGSIVTIEGMTSKGKLLRRAFTMTDLTTVLQVTPSDENGYTISIDASSNVLAGLRPITPASMIVVVKPGDPDRTLSFAVSPFLDKKTCLFVSSPRSGEVAGPASFTFLQRLTDTFGAYISNGIDLQSRLVSRQDAVAFFMSLSCTDATTDVVRLRKDLDTALDAGKLAGRSIYFKDLPLSKLTRTAANFYSLRALGVDVARGNIADPLSPITQGEFIKAVSMLLPERVIERVAREGEILPSGLTSTDSLTPYFRTLNNLGLLPDSLVRSFDKRLGITWTQASDVLARLPFKLGTVDMQSQKQDRTDVPSFLRILPKGFVPASCGVDNEARAKNVVALDAPPGTSLYADVLALLPKGVKDADGKTLWLFSGIGLTRYGIEYGEISLHPDAPVTLASLLRMSLVSLCQPLDTRMAVITGRDREIHRQGTADTYSFVDAISGLKRNASLLSLIIYQAQQKTLPFSLHSLSFFPEFLRRESRDPLTLVSKRDAAGILSSMYLVDATRQKVLTTDKASELAQDLRHAILEDFAHHKVDVRTESSDDLSVPLTNSELIHMLAAPLRLQSGTQDVKEMRSIGVDWYYRVMQK